MVKPSDYMLMWFDLVVFLKTAALQTLYKQNLSTACPFLFLPLLIAISLSPCSVHLLRHSGPSVPHIIISENTHTAHALHHRWVALSLSHRWIGKYLLSQIVFLPLSSFYPSTGLLPLYTSMLHSCHFSGLFCPTGLAFILSQRALTGICCANMPTY